MKTIKLTVLLLVSVPILMSCSDDSTSKTDIEVDKTKQHKESLLLHVESPDWRDQIIYFVMLDRFQDGDKSNNDQGYNLYRPSDNHFYSGGDIKGLTQRVDYIKNLGATAVWLTPPNANLWWSESSKSTGYHGYWARDFKSIDEHYGTLDDYKVLSSKLHKNEMYLVQDIVTNHVGQFFEYQDEFDPANTAKNFSIVKGNIPSLAPTQSPLNLNNRLNPNHVTADIYHWTPEITDFYQQVQEFTYQLSGLNDLNTSNPVVRNTLKDSFGYWIKEVGVDAFRLDTAKFIEPDFINDFLHSENGIIASAKSTGRNSFPVFGEIFETSPPFTDSAERKIQKFIGTKTLPGLNGVIGFPLYKSIENVFRSGFATSQISYRIKKQMEFYSDPFMVLNFIDNHDVKRFQTKGNTYAVKQALTFIMTAPGIPVIYQGDEQGLLETREAMFKGGYHAKKDQFDLDSELYQFIQRVTKIRKKNLMLSRGNIEILADNEIGAGVLVFKRTYQNQSAIILFNTANESILLSNLNINLSSNQSIEVEFTENLDANHLKQNIRNSVNGQVTMQLPAKAIAILITKESATENQNKSTIVKNKLSEFKFNNSPQGREFDSAVQLSGSYSKANKKLLLVNNGSLDSAETIMTDEKGNWEHQIDNGDYGQVNHSIELYDSENNFASDKITFTLVNKKADIVLSINDPINDDNGPTNDYIKPTDSTFRNQMDIEHLDIKAGGKILVLKIKINELTSDWLAANHFDHVAFNIYFDLPNTDGLDFLPKINSKTKLGFSWNYNHQLFGWGNTVYHSKGATKHQLGTVTSKSPKLKVDSEKREITLIYNADIFDIKNWTNVKIYISTWDLDGEGEYRPLKLKPSRWGFASNNSDGTLILDEVGPVSIQNTSNATKR